MFGRKHRRQLRRENVLLREALDWYASSVNWRRRATNAKGEPVKWVKSPAAFDRGARAKFVLTQLEATASPDSSTPVAGEPHSTTREST